MPCSCCLPRWPNTQSQCSPGLDTFALPTSPRPINPLLLLPSAPVHSHLPMRRPVLLQYPVTVLNCWFAVCCNLPCRPAHPSLAAVPRHRAQPALGGGELQDAGRCEPGQNHRHWAGAQGLVERRCCWAGHGRGVGLPQAAHRPQLLVVGTVPTSLALPFKLSHNPCPASALFPPAGAGGGQCSRPRGSAR